MPSFNLSCPCLSKKIYVDCCKPYHLFQKLPLTADLLVKSRYSAYKLGLSDYIIETTHPSHPDKQRPRHMWRKEIILFSRTTKFVGCDILEFSEQDVESEVLFYAKLFQKNRDISFHERSYFEKINGKWLYKKGIIISSTY